ncbi:DNA repair protein rad52 [Borealophlyctis nickersoniae]|nr:DNA repair protein rad52 [Borealophlyctis nickersoniae]
MISSTFNKREHDHPGTFGSCPYSQDEARQVGGTLAKHLGPEYLSARSGPGGSRVHYIEGWKATNLANEIFGFNGWSHSVVDITVDFVDAENGRISMGLSSIVRVTLKDGTYHEDIGYGSIENAKTKGAAFEKCKKEAITDAVKRSLKHFGNSVGNCLYDKDYLKKVSRMTVQPSKYDPKDLHRHPSAVDNPPGPSMLPASAVPPAIKSEFAAPKNQANSCILVPGSSSRNDQEQYSFDDDDTLLVAADIESIDAKFLVESSPNNKAKGPNQNLFPNSPQLPSNSTSINGTWRNPAPQNNPATMTNPTSTTSGRGYPGGPQPPIANGGAPTVPTGGAPQGPPVRPSNENTDPQIRNTNAGPNQRGLQPPPTFPNASTNSNSKNNLNPTTNAHRQGTTSHPNAHPSSNGGPNLPPMKSLTPHNQGRAPPGPAMTDRGGQIPHTGSGGGVQRPPVGGNSSYGGNQLNNGSGSSAAGVQAPGPQMSPLPNPYKSNPAPAPYRPGAQPNGTRPMQPATSNGGPSRPNPGASNGGNGTGAGMKRKVDGDVPHPNSNLGSKPGMDPHRQSAVFTSLAERIGISGVEVEEVFDLADEFIDPIGETFGLIFLFHWRDKDTEEADQRRAMTNIPSELFFMNQVVQNACRTQALLSIAFNCPRINLSQELRYFKQFCLPLPPPMRGFALTNCQTIRTAHNRQTDLPVLEYYVPEKPEPESKKRSKKKGKRGKKRKWEEDSEEESEQQVVQEEITQFHFICYVPVNGPIWEIDGLKRTPKARGRVRNAENWIKDVRPVIQNRMADYEGKAIAFNLMALVPDRRELLNAEEAEIIAVEAAAKSKLQTLDTEAADRMDVDGSPVTLAT